MSEPFAWIVPICPDFYFMPTMMYHKIFKEWDNNGWDCPAYWAIRNYPIIPCYATEDEKSAECWISHNKYGQWGKQPNLKTFCTLPMWTEDLNASRSVAYNTQLLICDLFSPIDRGPIVGNHPTWKS